jgi:hypothetical protein
MKRILFFLFIIPFLSHSQVDFHNLQKQSMQVFAFKISAIEAEKCISLDSINIDAYSSVKPYAVFSKDSINENKFQTGHYVLISVEDNKIIAQLTGVSNLYAYNDKWFLPGNDNYFVTRIFKFFRWIFTDKSCSARNDNFFIHVLSVA